MFELRPEEFYQHILDQANVTLTRQSMEAELISLENKFNRNINSETEL
jgi:hypothetical protein